MATVRITDSLIDDVTRAARVTFGNGPSIDRFVDVSSLGDKIYEKIFAKWIPQFNALPMCFLSTAEDIAVLHVGGSSAKFTVPLSTRRPVPREMDEEVREEVGLTSFRRAYFDTSIQIGIARDVMPQLESALAAYSNAADTHEEERRAFINSVRALLSKYSTLNPALKEWPPLWDLLPDEVKERHKRVVTRKPKQDDRPEVELEMDLNKMTAKVIAAKVRG